MLVWLAITGNGSPIEIISHHFNILIFIMVLLLWFDKVLVPTYNNHTQVLPHHHTSYLHKEVVRRIQIIFFFIIVPISSFFYHLTTFVKIINVHLRWITETWKLRRRDEACEKHEGHVNCRLKFGQWCHYEGVHLSQRICKIKKK